ncbi:hypothetical protein, partial [Enterobacter hormaechei]
YNPADSHPIVAHHLITAKNKPAKNILSDTPKNENARIAHMQIAQKKPKKITQLNKILSVSYKNQTTQHKRSSISYFLLCL